MRVVVVMDERSMLTQIADALHPVINAHAAAGMVLMSSTAAAAILAAVPLIAALDDAHEGWLDWSLDESDWAVYPNQDDGEYSIPDKNRVLVIPAPEAPA